MIENVKKTQEEYALEIDAIVSRDVEVHQNDWFKIDRPIFLLPENKDKSFILATRSTGCELLMLTGGTNFNECQINQVIGSLGNKKFYICHPTAYFMQYYAGIKEVDGLYVVKEISRHLPIGWYLIYQKLGYWEMRNFPL